MILWTSCTTCCKRNDLADKLYNLQLEEWSCRQAVQLVVRRTILRTLAVGGTDKRTSLLACTFQWSLGLTTHFTNVFVIVITPSITLAFYYFCTARAISTVLDVVVSTIRSLMTCRLVFSKHLNSWKWTTGRKCKQPYENKVISFFWDMLGFVWDESNVG